MPRQSPKSNDTELQFAALGATLKMLVCTLALVALWQIFVLLEQVFRLITVYPWNLAEVM